MTIWWPTSASIQPRTSLGKRDCCSAERLEFESEHEREQALQERMAKMKRAIELSGQGRAAFKTRRLANIELLN